MKTETTVMKVPKDLVQRLKAMRRPHQSIAGVIEELLLTRYDDSYRSKVIKYINDNFTGLPDGWWNNLPK